MKKLFLWVKENPSPFIKLALVSAMGSGCEFISRGGAWAMALGPFEVLIVVGLVLEIDTPSQRWSPLNIIVVGSNAVAITFAVFAKVFG